MKNFAYYPLITKKRPMDVLANRITAFCVITGLQCLTFALLNLWIGFLITASITIAIFFTKWSSIPTAKIGILTVLNERKSEFFFTEGVLPLYWWERVEIFDQRLTTDVIEDAEFKVGPEGIEIVIPKITYSFFIIDPISYEGIEPDAAKRLRRALIIDAFNQVIKDYEPENALKNLVEISRAAAASIGLNDEKKDEKYVIIEEAYSAIVSISASGAPTYANPDIQKAREKKIIKRFEGEGEKEEFQKLSEMVSDFCKNNGIQNPTPELLKELIVLAQIQDGTREVTQHINSIQIEGLGDNPDGAKQFMAMLAAAIQMFQQKGKGSAQKQGGKKK